MTKSVLARRWMITLPAGEYDEATVVEQLKSYNYVGQLEKAASGYEHWQIYIDNRGKGNIRFATLRSKFPKGHFEKAIGTPAECVAYVSKVDTSLGVVVKNGEIDTAAKAIGQAAIMARATEMILENGQTSDDVLEELGAGFGNARAIREIEAFAHRRMAREQAEQGGIDRSVSFITGAPGVGKTALLYRRHGADLYSATSYKHPFDEYVGQSVMLLDEYAGQIEFELLLKMLDRYPVNLPARFNNKFALYDTIYMVSNLRLEDLYKSVQRHRPEQWNALVRRIGTYQEMDADGVLHDLPLPWIDVADDLAA